MDGTIGEIRLFAGDYAPVHWEFCHGQLFPVNANQPLFSILGTTYGGDGIINFALPDFRGRVAAGAGQGAQLSAYYLGKTGGKETATVDISNMPVHDHNISGTVTMPCLAADGDQESPGGGYPAMRPGKNMYTTIEGTFIMGAMQHNLNTDQKGLSQPFSIIQPVLGLSWIICISGLFPERP